MSQGGETPGWGTGSAGSWNPPEPPTVTDDPKDAPLPRPLDGGAPVAGGLAGLQAGSQSSPTVVTPPRPEYSGFVPPQPPVAKRRRRGGLIAVLAAVVVLVGVIAVGIAGSSHTATPSSAGPPSRVVLTSARTTLAARTADLHVAMTLTIPGGTTVTASGDGAVNFSANAADLSFRYQGLPEFQGKPLTELMVGNVMYLSMPGVSQLAPGASWVSEPIGSSSSITPGSSNPATMFQMLEARGDQITALGPSTLSGQRSAVSGQRSAVSGQRSAVSGQRSAVSGQRSAVSGQRSAVSGQPVQAYRVVITPESIAKSIESSQLPASLVQAAKSMFGSSTITMEVYVNDVSSLVQRISYDIDLTEAGTTVTAHASEDFSNYGTSVSITPPPADQVVSLSQFEQAAASAGSSSGTA